MGINRILNGLAGVSANAENKPLLPTCDCVPFINLCSMILKAIRGRPKSGIREPWRFTFKVMNHHRSFVFE